MGERDRLEIYSGWDYVAPEDTVYSDRFNNPSAVVRETLALPLAGSDSMRFPGMHFRFFSGPSVTYPGTLLFSSLNSATRPRGEGTGFLVDSITLYPSSPAVRGYTSPLTLTAYERAMVVIAPGTGEDHVPVYLDPAIARPTVAAWTQGGTTGTLFANCGADPSWSDYDAWIYLGPSGDVLDLTGISCPGNDWRLAVVAGSAPTGIVVNLRVGANTSAARNYNLVVGLEAAGSANELAYVRRVMRDAAWIFYGVTGGTHIIRTYTYQNGTCGGAHICFRNRSSGCVPAAITHTTGSTPSIAVDICRDLSSGMFTGTSPDPINDSLVMAHEYGHLLTANGTLNAIGDEYWNASTFSPICGTNYLQVNLCAHSLMADVFTTRRLYSLCTSATHDRASAVSWQSTAAATFVNRIGTRSVAGGTGPSTDVVECWDGSRTYVGPFGSAAWSVLAGSGAAPLPHPLWSPDNHSYRNFSDGPSIVVGRNL